MTKNKDAEKADQVEDREQGAKGGGDVSGKDPAPSGAKVNDEDGGASADTERSREIHIKD